MTRLFPPPSIAPAEPAAVPPALRCTGLVKRFGGVTVIDGLSLTAAAGEFVALLGPSGCGKTTTLRLIAGFETQDEGMIEIAGQVVAGPDRWVPPQQRRIGMVFQDYALFPHLTVAGNVGFGLPRGRERSQRIATALDRVGLSELGQRMPHELSGGQQQRVALARALAPEPAIVLLDEPFSNLDAALRASVRAEVRQLLADVGTTALLVTHDQEEALSLADCVAVMRQGRIVQVGTPEDVYHRPVDPWVAAFIGDAQFLPGEARGRSVATELGEASMHGLATGPVQVLLRPEALHLSRVSDEVLANATVRGRIFYGHDQLLTVHLDSGRLLQARTGGSDAVRPGDRVRVTVAGTVTAFADTPRDQ